MSTFTKERTRVHIHRVILGSEVYLLPFIHIDKKVALELINVLILPQKLIPIHVTINISHNLCIVSSAKGPLCLYDTLVQEKEIDPCVTLDRVHGREGVSWTLIHVPASSQSIEFSTCGKDGRYNRFILTKGKVWTIERVQSMTITPGWLERVSVFCNT